MRYLNTLRAVLFCLFALLAGCATSPEQIQTRATSGVVESRDGIPIVYENFGEGEIAVVFVHCWACNRQFWRYQVESVADAGYRIVTLDLPGHGESGRGRENWSLDSIANDVEDVIRALKLDRVILVGHAMGGRVALASASRLPEHVIGIGCVDTLRNAEFKWADGFVEQLAEVLKLDYRQGMESFVRPFVGPGSGSALVRWIVSQAVETDESAAVGLLIDVPSTNLPNLFSNAGVPIRCINAAPRGTQVVRTEIEINRKYADFDAVLMGGVGHYPHLEQPEVFNVHLLDILAELAARDQ